jgi:hypothetical protein
MSKYALFLLTAIAMADTVPVDDENLRLMALHAAFPGTQISVARGEKVDDSWPEEQKTAQLSSPDALARENIYRVTGNVVNEAEKVASDQLITHQPSNTRLVRFQVFHWPEGAGLLAVLQYKFEDALPSMECPSIGLLVHLENVEGSWQARDRYLVQTMYHSTLQTIRMMNLNGEGADQLVLESDFGGADTWGTNMMIFNLGPKIELAFETTSQIMHGSEDMFTQVLDVPGTIEQHGMEVCFTKTTMFEDGKLFNPARITKPCYFPDADGNARESEERGRLLAPVTKR